MSFVKGASFTTSLHERLRWEGIQRTRKKTIRTIYLFFVGGWGHRFRSWNTNNSRGEPGTVLLVVLRVLVVGYDHTVRVVHMSTGIKSIVASV